MEKEYFDNLKEAKECLEKHLYDNIKNPSELMSYSVDINNDVFIAVHNKLMQITTTITLEDLIVDAKANVDGLVEVVNKELDGGLDYYEDRKIEVISDENNEDATQVIYLVVEEFDDNDKHLRYAYFSKELAEAEVEISSGYGTLFYIEEANIQGVSEDVQNLGVVNEVFVVVEQKEDCKCGYKYGDKNIISVHLLKETAELEAKNSESNQFNVVKVAVDHGVNLDQEPTR